MILGEVCTRACAFCNVATGKPDEVDKLEPLRIGVATMQMGLKHVVVTAVDRDDLKDGGADHFAKTIMGIRMKSPNTTIEILPGDFKGDMDDIDHVIAAKPDVFNHNMETVPRLYPTIRPGARYFRSLRLLERVKDVDPSIFTKSGMMVGLGETMEEVSQVMDDMRAARIDFITIGQYLQPTPKHAPVMKWWTPEEFEKLTKMAKRKGFLMVSASPLTRSSHHAGDDFEKLKSAKRVILALDNDAPGQCTVDAMVELFGRWRCLVIDWPVHDRATGLDGKCKDLNEVLKLLGPDTAAELIRNAKPLKLCGVYEPKDIPKPPQRKYYSVGVHDKNGKDLFRLFKGGLSVVSGITNHGKTNFLFWMLAQLIEEYGLKVGLGTFEDEYWEDIVPWYGDYLFGTDKPDNWEDLTNDWMQENFRIISYQIEPLTEQASIEWYLQQCQAAIGRYGLDVFVLDPWNKIQHKRGKGEAETDYIGRALAEVKNFAMVNHVAMVVTCHPTKETHAGGTVHIPNITQLHGSMNWGNGSDHVAIVFRPDLTKTTTCISLQKVKHQTNQYREGAGFPGASWFIYKNCRYERKPLDQWPNEGEF